MPDHPGLEFVFFKTVATLVCEIEPTTFISTSRSAIARTDWSWATLLADFDNAGRKDVFITNGYRKNITDRDFMTYAEEYSFFGSDKARTKKRDEMLSKVPEIKLKNYAYRNVTSF